MIITKDKKPLDLWLSDLILPNIIVQYEKIIKNVGQSRLQLRSYETIVDKDTKADLIKPYTKLLEQLGSRAIITQEILNQLVEIPKPWALHFALYSALENITRMGQLNKLSPQR